MENDSVSNSTGISTVYFITFISLLIVEIPSICCTLLIMIYICCHWQLTIVKSLHHHVIFLLILVSFFYVTLDLPFTISTYRLGYDYFRTPSFCLWWFWVDYTISAMSLFLTATASIQRHFLIFNSHWFRIKRTRWFVHFFPLIFCITYPPLCYIALVYFYPCETVFPEEETTCAAPCYGRIILIFNLDWVINCIIPIFIIVLSNIVLICRIVCSRQRVRQRRHFSKWKKQKKLFFQLLGLSMLYICGWGPTTVLSMMNTFIMPDLFDNNPGMNSIQCLVYFVCPLQTFICIFAMPELVHFIRIRIIRRFKVVAIQ
ncbi:unnamed protein product [Adineta ricciae]|uniref:G-protein coupled receptors family 1 profile domain-containing protein n=1 Tax=Adineta ricciae TaxID=249248 RepID=A0A815HZY0_ADIRI|nr:unnamed protein product [Adineta ricciae]CAF1441470.1 unnamed protein product [Adineta ricciae]